MHRITDRGALALVAVVCAVGVPIVADGGLDPGARLAFAALALGAALVAGARASAPVLALLGLAALSALSALWTIGVAGDALRWAAVLGGYGLVAAAAAAVARDGRRAVALPALVCLAAAVSGVWGLVALAGHALPYAERIEGAWRPGGPFEYPPALALVEVCALPALVTAARRGPWWRRVPAAAGLAVALGVLAFAGNRTAWSLAAAVVVWALAGRRAGALAFGLAFAAGLLVLVLGGGHGRPALWSAGLDAWARRPIAGSGAETFFGATVLDQPGRPAIAYAHSLPVEWLVELGLIGLLAGLAVAATAVRAAWASDERLLAPAVVAFLLAGLVDWSWHLAGAGAVWAVALGGAVAARAGPGSVGPAT